MSKSLNDSLNEFDKQARAAEKNGEYKKAAVLFRQASDTARQLAESLRTSETRQQYMEISNRLMLCAQKCNEKASRPIAEKQHTEGTPAASRGGAPSDENTKPKRDESETDWIPKSVKSKGFSDVAGLDYVKETAKLLIIDSLKHRDLAERWNVRSEGILMYGLPGTGKTTVAEAISVEAKSTLFHVSCSDIDSKWVGESARNVKNLFVAARSYESSIIFFDDCEGLCKKRDSGNDSTSAKVVAELLRQIDEVLKDKDSKILILYATNQPWALDSAVLSRTQRKFYIPLPDVVAREDILKKGFRELSADDKNNGQDFKILPMDDDISLEDLAESLKNYGGRDIMNLCQTVRLRVFSREVANRKDEKQNRIEKISSEDIECARKIVKPSITAGDEAKLKEFMQENDPDVEM